MLGALARLLRLPAPPFAVSAPAGVLRNETADGVQRRPAPPAMYDPDSDALSRAARTPARPERADEDDGDERTSATEGALGLCDVLEEEYRALHPTETVRWPVGPDQVRDIAGLARRLAAALRAPAAPDDDVDPLHVIARRLPPPTRAAVLEFVDAAAVDSFAPATIAAGKKLRIVLAEELTAVLAAGELSAHRCLDPARRTVARESPPRVTWAVRLWRREATRAPSDPGAERGRQALERAILEAAFPEIESVIHGEVRLRAAVRRMHARGHAALCLSGGGIRSATFSLGVVQALARYDDGLLSRFHYLSTVSGGGYLGGWLSAWAANEKHDFSRVVAGLRQRSTSILEPDPAPITHLRSYSNYLAPRPGLLAADTWTLFATYLRNLFLTWLILIPLLVAVTLLPRLVSAVLRAVPTGTLLGMDLRAAVPGVLLLLGLALGAIAVAFTHAYRPPPPEARPEPGASTPPVPPRVDDARDQGAFLRACLVPLVLSNVLLTTAWWWWTSSPDVRRAVGATWVGGVVPLAEGWTSPDVVDRWGALAAFVTFGTVLHLGGWLLANWRGGIESLRSVIPAAVTGAVGGALAYVAADGVATIAQRLSDASYVLSGELTPADVYAWLAVPSLLSLILLGGSLYVGLRGDHADDSAREWFARFAGWVLIVVVSWLVFTGIVLCLPPVVRGWQREGTGAFAVLGSLSGVVTAWLGRSGKTPATQSSKAEAGTRPSILARLLSMGLGMAATVCTVFLVVVFALLGAWLLPITCTVLGSEGCARAPMRSVAELAARASWYDVVALGAALVALGLLMSRFINTNRFSLHAMYRSRLIRAYLAASRPQGQRHPHPFTGFDESDNLQMWQLWPERTADAYAHVPPPLHVVNLTLNLVGGQKLAWQERKAESFTVSALHAGSFHIDPAGYRRTSARPGEPPPGAEGDGRQRTRVYGGYAGISLGTAITISGAAASPNMGYHSSSTVTFLMTLLNARLGWWLGNPGRTGERTYYRSGPRSAVKPLLDEMFGKTDDQAPYVHLSDGGHFENLALYEMVLRRCRTIVVVDASADPTGSFADLGNAIRKIRVDFGIPIEFVSDDFRIRARAVGERAEKNELGGYWAVGKIRYSAVDARDGEDPADFDGRIIYIKPAFYGSEPRDVCDYAAVNQSFPHETTGDQFFSESQFESYRTLGEYIATSACATLQLKDSIAPRG